MMKLPPKPPQKITIKPKQAGKPGPIFVERSSTRQSGVSQKDSQAPATATKRDSNLNVNQKYDSEYSMNQPSEKEAKPASRHSKQSRHSSEQIREEPKVNLEVASDIVTDPGVEMVPSSRQMVSPPAEAIQSFHSQVPSQIASQVPSHIPSAIQKSHESLPDEVDEDISQFKGTGMVVEEPQLSLEKEAVVSEKIREEH